MKPTAIGVGAGTTWGGIGLSQANLVPANKSGGGGIPPLNQGSGGGGGGSGSGGVPCPTGCGCHPLWYLGAATGIMLLITVLLARA